MIRLILPVFIAFFAIFGSASVAQDTAYIQIEAQPNLRQAQERARAYGNAFDNVAGFALGAGWYGVVLGPYDRNVIDGTLRQLKRDNLIPGDAYIAPNSSLGQQFWPIGGIQRAIPQVQPESRAIPETPVVAPEPIPEVAPVETLRQSRAAEAALSRDEKRALQEALKWEGFYTAAIDGSFGRGTRNSMAAYQTEMGYEATGVLSTEQRTELMDNYTAVLAALGLETIREDEAGIEIKIPANLVAFDKYEAPFVHYKPTDATGAQVLLISQPGDRASLFGLYDVMQTLKIVPSEGERSRSETSFTLRGEDDTIHSYTFARLSRGLIKGFTLVWPAGDDKRMNRVVSEMQASFAPYGDYSLDETLGAGGADQQIDLLAGLEVRGPTRVRSGFYLNDAGDVITTAEAVNACTRVTIDGDTEVEVSYADADVAVLKAKTPLSPPFFAQFGDTLPRLKSDVAAAGFSYEGVLGAPTVTFGTLADVRGLNGEETRVRLSLNTRASDTGGPVLDQSGAVMGILLAKSTGAQQLPQDVQFALNAGAIANTGVAVTTATTNGALAPEDLTQRASDITVLVECWSE